MSHFEFNMIAVSMILAMGIGRILEGIVSALQPARRYWVHAGWLVILFSSMVMWWWTIWTFQGLEWNLGMFLLYLAIPVIWYLQVVALVSPSVSDTASCRVRFNEVRRWFMAGYFVAVALLIVGSLWRPNVEYEPPVTALYLSALTAAVGFANSTHAVQVAVLLATGAIQAYLVIALFQLPA